jgi:hypothetical protein
VVALDSTLSLEEVGELVGHSADWVKRRITGFEHLKVGRSVRFTTEQAGAFIRSFTVSPGDGNDDDDTDPLRDQSSKSKNRRK